MQLKSEVLERKRRAATARPERLWDHAVIPYEIEANFSGESPDRALDRCECVSLCNL